MNHEDFDNILKDTVAVIAELVSHKGSIYASDDNRLHNFDRAAEVENISTLEACRGMWTKQLVSLLDAIENTTDGDEPVWSQGRCDEVIHDLLVYLILTKALFYRGYGWEPKCQTKNARTASTVGRGAR